MALNLLLFPRQRLKRVQLEVANLSDAVMKLYSLDLSGLRWAECREGVLARLPGGASPEMLVRIPSAKLECTALLVHTGAAHRPAGPALPQAGPGGAAVLPDPRPAGGVRHHSDGLFEHSGPLGGAPSRPRPPRPLPAPLQQRPGPL